jgi:undecaprenyl-diphosphatase
VSATWVIEIAELLLVVSFLYLAVRGYVARARPGWSAALAKRRRVVLLVLALLVVAIEVGEDVIDGESGPVDRAIMLFVHEHVRGGWVGFFELVTLTGSSKFLLPLTVLTTVALAWRRHWTEAKLLALSVAGGALVIYCVKLAVARERPALWETEWYWGSSFPSGHTLAVAAFATAGVVCAERLRPRLHVLAGWSAGVWIALVGLSRLVLGVHWPTDVLVAACIGVSLPLAMSLALEARRG